MPPVFPIPLYELVHLYIVTLHIQYTYKKKLFFVRYLWIVGVALPDTDILLPSQWVSQPDHVIIMIMLCYLLFSTKGLRRLSFVTC